MINKYTVNQLIFLVNLLCFLVVFYLVFSQDYFFNVWLIPSLIIIAINLHYFLNILHLATHSQVSKNKQINLLIGRISAILGGLNYAEFSKTHLSHHSYPGNKDKDPDYLLTKSGSLLTLPFRIWVKDKYFWNSNLSKAKGYKLMYIQDRIIQLAILALILFSSKLQYFLIFWSLPALLVGFSYGFYLFYFPHYISKWEVIKRDSLKTNLIERSILFSIDISRFYHTQHHFKVGENRNYYPLATYFKDFIQNKIPDNFSKERTFTA
jgi:fatty acid desaturase